MTGDRIPIEIVHEDDDLVVVVKPAGLPTANAAAGVASVYTILSSRTPGGFIGIVSRLDAPVSGILLVAKTRGAAAALAEQFRWRTVEKTYRAVVEGRFPAPLGVWVDWHDTLRRRPGERRSELLGRPGGPGGPGGAPPRPGPVRDPHRLQHAAGVEPDQDDDARPLPAHVRARVVRRAGEVSLVDLLPSTGRRHQLRLQLSARGCPIVGDWLYGARLPLAVRETSQPGFRRPSDGRTGPSGPSTAAAAIALHAERLRFTHPRTQAVIEVTAPVPTDWRRRFPALFTGDRSAGD